MVDAGMNDKVSDNPAASTAHRRKVDARSLKLIECPFEVRIDGAPHDEFYDLRDAIASARNAKGHNPASTIIVTDVRTGQLVFEVEA